MESRIQSGKLLVCNRFVKPGLFEVDQTILSVSPLTFACTSSSLFHRKQTLVSRIEASDVLVCFLVSLFSLCLKLSFLPGILGSGPGRHCLSSSDTHLSMSVNPCAAVTAHRPYRWVLPSWSSEKKPLAAPLSRSAAASVKPGTSCERKSPKLKIKIKPSRSLRSGPLRQCHLKKGLNKKKNLCTYFTVSSRVQWGNMGKREIKEKLEKEDVTVHR